MARYTIILEYFDTATEVDGMVVIRMGGVELKDAVYKANRKALEMEWSTRIPTVWRIEDADEKILKKRFYG